MKSRKYRYLMRCRGYCRTVCTWHPFPDGLGTYVFVRVFR